MSHTKITWYFTLFVFLSFSAEAAEIRVKPEARIQGSLVRLGDVADIQAADAQQREKLQRLELYPAPAIGTCHTVRQQEIRELLNLNGFDAGSITVTGAAAVRLTAAARTPLTEAETGIIGSDARIPSGNANVAVRKPSTAAVVVAARALDRGELITEGDLQTATLDTLPRGLAPLERIEQAVGQQATRFIEKGQPLDSRYLQRPVLVRRGETVTVNARTPGICVRTTAKALEDGTRDDLIMLESPDNRQRYAARVVGLQLAEVVASGIQVPRISQNPAPATPLR